LHAASAVDIMAGSLRGFQQWVFCSIFFMTVLTVGVYLPVGRLLQQVATPIRFVNTASPFAAGDVVLVNVSAYRGRAPSPGDVVMYNLSEQDVRTPRRGGNPTVYRMAGGRIDRVIAQGGQKVTFHSGELLVDGKPSIWQPLNPQRIPDGFEVAVPKGHYLLFPSTDPMSYPLAVWQSASVIPQAEITGRVYLRNYPLWRLSRIR
jgi:signal peptidase I